MKKLTLLALLLGLLTGCGAAKAATALPAAMPADFEIRYEYWIDEAAPNIYDTGERLLQKDLVDPDGQPTAHGCCKRIWSIRTASPPRRQSLRFRTRPGRRSTIKCAPARSTGWGTKS